VVEWTAADDLAAYAEGWGLFPTHTNGYGLPADHRIERLDIPSHWGSTVQLASDEEAIALVRAGTKPHHVKALALHVAWTLNNEYDTRSAV
jgi:hypothetical protein